MQRIGRLLTLIFVLMAMSTYAYAMPNLTFDSINVLPGQTGMLTLGLSGGGEPYAGVNAKIILPEGITIASVSRGALLPDGFMVDWCSVHDQADNWVTVIAYSGTHTFSAPSGSILNMAVQIASDAAIGTHNVQFADANSGLSNQDGSVSVTHATSNGTINCVDPAGDFDDDGLTSSEECTFGTDPFHADTDGDGCLDGYEYYSGTNPNAANDYPLNEVVFVDNTGNDANIGLDFRCPKKTIQAAIDAAADAQIVVVREGTYTGPGNRDLDLLCKAITVRSRKGANNTIIDCEYNGRGFYIHSGETSSSIVDGFTIKNGNADKGAGIYCLASSPALYNCIVIDNTAETLGGGIACSNHSSPILSNCIIAGNVAVFGGGICNDTSSSPTLTDSIIRNNSATQGGGVGNYTSSSPTISGCVLEDNVAETGAGVYSTEGSAPPITGCTISRNQASGYSGGIHCYRSAAPLIANCVINENRAARGAAMSCQDYAQPTMLNCTIIGNQASDFGGGIYIFGLPAWPVWPVVANSILWGNTYPQVHSDSGTVIVTYCDIDQDGYDGSDGNIRQDPLFVDPENGDFKLNPLSPCINTGTAIDWIFSDLRGSLRPVQSGLGWAGFDMGAFEHSYSWSGAPDAVTKAFANVTIDDSHVITCQEHRIEWQGNAPFPGNDQRITEAGQYEVRLALVDDTGRRIDLKTLIVPVSPEGYSVPVTFRLRHVGKWRIRVELAADPNQFDLSEQVTISHNEQEYCQCDLDRDGDSDGRDLVDFIAAYATGGEEADLNGDGFVDSADLAEFAKGFGR
ncbi:MAG: NosD domain-containing protein [Pseudomonadota bacterium]